MQTTNFPWIYLKKRLHTKWKANAAWIRLIQTVTLGWLPSQQEAIWSFLQYHQSQHSVLVCWKISMLTVEKVTKLEK